MKMVSKDEIINLISINFNVPINKAVVIYSGIQSISDHNREFEKENVKNFYEDLCNLYHLSMIDMLEIEKIIAWDGNIEDNSVCKICEYIECPVDNKYCRMTPEEAEQLERCKIKTEPIIRTEPIIPISKRLCLFGDDEDEKIIQKLLAKRKENQKREIDLE